MLVIVAPGQGAQTPGFLAPWLEDDTFATRMHWLSTVAGIDLAEHGTNSDADTIRDTQVAQPLLVATALVSSLELFPHPADAFGKIGAVAGHSVGELAAAAGARTITAEQAMVLVRERGRAMAEAAKVTPTGMTAVLGGDRDEVLAAADKHGLTPANDNGPGQVVVAGTMEQLAAFAEDPPEKARLMPLPVAGAFHTHHMAPAVDHLARLAGSVSIHDPRIPVISNRDGHVVHSGRDILRRIIGQIANPVRWDLCLDAMSDLGVTGILEMPPAGTLTGIAKRALKGVETFALKTPDQLDDARAFCDKHGEGSLIDTTPTWRMVVSPAKGTFTIDEAVADADLVPVGAEIGAVSSLRDTIPHQGRPRRSGGRVARRGRRPRLPRPAAAPPPPGRGRRVSETSRSPSCRSPPAPPTPASSASAATAPSGSCRTPRSSSASTAATSGSSSAPASRPAASPATTRPCSRWPSTAVPAGARALRPRQPADRRRRHRHRHPPAADAVAGQRRRPRARHRPGRRLRHLRRLRRLLPRRRPGLRPGARRERRPRAGDRRRAALRHHRQRRPRHRVHLRRRRGRGRRRTERDPGHRSGRLGLRRRAVRPDPAARGLARRPRRREARDAAPGDAGQRRVPVGLVHDGQDRPAGARPGRHHRRRPRRASCRTRPTCASPTPWPGR